MVSLNYHGLFSVERVLATFAILVATVIVAVALRSIMRRSLRPRLPAHVYRLVENGVFYTVVIIGVLSILGIYGVSVSGLLVAGGFAGLVVGLASQQAVSNLVSGLFLLAEQPLRVGDPVSVADVGGVVVDINILSTRIRTWDGYIVRIPNSKVFESMIVNYQRTRARRVEFSIGISYDSDLNRAIEAIKQMIDEHPFCLVNPGAQIFVDEYADSAVVLKVRCWAPPEVWFDTKVELQTRIKEVLERAGITIPFPQLDLHIRDSSTIPVSLANAKISAGDGEENA